jgi:hypothetical protein
MRGLTIRQTAAALKTRSPAALAWTRLDITRATSPTKVTISRNYWNEHNIINPVTFCRLADNENSNAEIKLRVVYGLITYPIFLSGFGNAAWITSTRRNSSACLR